MRNSNTSIKDIADDHPELLPDILVLISGISALVSRLYELLDEAFGGDKG